MGRAACDGKRAAVGRRREMLNCFGPRQKGVFE
jgi:hypothetical protein